MEEGGGIGPLGEMLFGGLPLLRGKECGACSYEKDEMDGLEKIEGVLQFGRFGDGRTTLGLGTSKQS